MLPAKWNLLESRHSSIDFMYCPLHVVSLTLREATNAHRVMTNDRSPAGCTAASLCVHTQTHTYTRVHTHAHIKVLQGNKHKIAYTTCCSSIEGRTSAFWGGNCKNLFWNSSIKNAHFILYTATEYEALTLERGHIILLLLVFLFTFYWIFFFSSHLCLQCRVRTLSQAPGRLSWRSKRSKWC